MSFYLRQSGSVQIDTVRTMPQNNHRENCSGIQSKTDSRKIRCPGPRICIPISPEIDGFARSWMKTRRSPLQPVRICSQFILGISPCIVDLEFKDTELIWQHSANIHPQIGGPTLLEISNWYLGDQCGGPGKAKTCSRQFTDSADRSISDDETLQPMLLTKIGGHTRTASFSKMSNPPLDYVSRNKIH